MTTQPSSGDSSSTNAPRTADLLPPNWPELAPLLDELLDAPTEERAARIVELSQGNATRQRELAQLLAEAERSMPLLESHAVHRFDELASNDADATLPEVLGGRYRRGRELGRGGMATVYLARDLKHDRDVAIKVIRPDVSASLGHERFLREIEIAARLRHPNIVPLYDSGEVEGSLFFVMPYEDGQSLRERLRQGGALPIADALSVLRDVARALAHAHERGVVHRDIKPDNVLLSGDAAVVTDFGIAKAVSVALTDTGGATLTQAGTVIGTPAYMAPEQATGDASIDHRADIYSFGCLAYELLTGHPPFNEQSSHLLIAAHIATVPRPIGDLRPDVPAAVGELVARCLAKAPPDRPPSARDLLPLLDGAGNVGVSSPVPVAQRTARGWTRARTSATVAIAAGVVALVGYGAIRTVTAAAPVTVAVLPFGNIAGDSTMEFIGDGLADEVASSLSRVPGILIKSRIGALRYRGRLGTDVTEAGARLKADYLVSGVIRQDRGRWVLSADFARAIDGSSLWDDRFVMDPNEQTAAADTLTGRLAAKLRRLFPRAVGLAAPRLPNRHTPSTEAHRVYLLGLARLNGRVGGVRDASNLFRQAIEQDSLYADAYSGWAMALALMPWFHHVRPSLVHDSVVTAARRALALDSTQALPHVALGRSYWNLYDWRRAESEFVTAVRLDPANVEARVQYGWLLRNTGRYAQALAQLRVAEKADPSSPVVLSHYAYAYAQAGQMDSAVAEAERALATDSNNLSTRALSLPVYLKAGRFKEARALAVRDNNRSMLARLGEPTAAREALRTLDAEPSRPGQDGRRADLYLALDDTANALTALERSTADSDLWAITLNMGDAKYDGIRHSARFRVLLERVGLHDYISTFTR